jgi:hypothetical protein
MPYLVEHVLAAQSKATRIRTSNGLATAHFKSSGPIDVGYPGRLEVTARAGYFQEARVERDDGRPARWEKDPKTLRLKTAVRTPDGNLFTKDHISLDDLRRFRDLRGVSQGTWSYSVEGESDPAPIDDEDVRLAAGKGYLEVTVTETVESKSANPLVNSLVAARQGRGFGFDLWRTGTFVATVRPPGSALRSRPRTLRLQDPDGNAVAESSTGELTFPVTLRTLDRSRDANGAPRRWE